MPRVPSRSHYDPLLDCVLHTGQNAFDAALEFPVGADLAIDIETPGFAQAFTIRCVTVAWERSGEMHTALFDAGRDEKAADMVSALIHHCGRLILHNAPYDVPALYHHRILDFDGIDKITDTLVLARMAYPNPLVKKDLTAMSIKHLGLDEFAGGMATAFKAAGFATLQEGYEGMDIDSPIYRFGAMADTVATLRLEPVLRFHTRALLTDHRFNSRGAETTDDADAVIATQETVNRIMLRRTAVGLNVDLEYLEHYTEQIVAEQARAHALLGKHGLEGGAGKATALITYLHEQGELPAGWRRTPSGKQLSATKADLDSLDHPLAHAQRQLAEMDKVLTYLTKVTDQARVTGRCHPQVGICAASATGRWSYSSPELQQFPAPARPVIVADDGLTMWSIDWSQIEPVTMGLMAKDEKFLAPYEAGDDLYEPLMRAAGVNRKVAKTVLLATMYGQGVAGMASRIGASLEQATQIRRQILAAMPGCSAFMSRVQHIASTEKMVVTGGRRILPVDEGGIFKSVNYIVQGTAADILDHAIVEIDRRGLGDAILLGMHDEIVVQGDAEVAREVEEVMQTPPAFLEEWACRTPILRTDCAPTGHAWASV